MRSIYTLLLFLLTATLSSSPGQAQTSVGIGTTTPDANAVLDIHSSTQGVLLPRLSPSQQATLASLLNAGELGMVVRDSASGKPVYWTGGTWKDASGLTVTATSPLNVSSLNNIALNPGTAKGDLITWDGNNWLNLQPAAQHFTVSANNVQPYLTLNYCIALQGIFPSQNSSAPYISEIELFAFEFAPKGFAFCNGQLLPINQNQALFSLIGTFYGGNGTTNFQLPNLQGRLPVHMGSNGTSNYVLGATGGIEINTISR